jgi:hypothetical protein
MVAEASDVEMLVSRRARCSRTEANLGRSKAFACCLVRWSRYLTSERVWLVVVWSRCLRLLWLRGLPGECVK